MNATFSYTGNVLTISLSLEDDGDHAIAKIVEQRLHNASVSVSHSCDRFGYGDTKPNGIHVTLSAPQQERS